MLELRLHQQLLDMQDYQGHYPIQAFRSRGNRFLEGQQQLADVPIAEACWGTNLSTVEVEAVYPLVILLQCFCLVRLCQ
jgi:hypothetical protein